MPEKRWKKEQLEESVVLDVFRHSKDGVAYIELPENRAVLKGQGVNVIMIPGPDRQLLLMEEEQWNRMCEKCEHEQDNGKKKRMIRILYGKAFHTQMIDSRVDIPDYFLNMTGIQKQVHMFRMKNDLDVSCRIASADTQEEKMKKKDTVKDFTKLGRYLCMILRHRPEVIGIQLDEHGWADVEELVAGVATDRTFSRDILEEIVRTDSKRRYSFNEDKTKIRANQGHSIDVDLEFETAQPPEYLWHGTAEKYVNSIEEKGLLPKSRRYVHLSLDVQTAVKVGKRHGSPVVYRIRSGEMYRNGFRFYISANGIWQTIMVPVEYLERQDLAKEHITTQ